MKKKDFIFIAAILIVAGLFFGYNKIKDMKGTNTVQIYSDNELYKEVSLDEECEFEIEYNGGHNVVKIHDGGVEVTDADCPDKVCVHTGFINKPSQSIVCIPNRLNIIINGEGDDAGHDAVVQ